MSIPFLSEPKQDEPEQTACCPHCGETKMEVWTATPRRVDLATGTIFDGPNSDHTEIFCLGCNAQLDFEEAPGVWAAQFEILDK